MSTIVGNVVLEAAKSHPQYAGHEIASALAIIVGAIVCFLGLARLGWIVDQHLCWSDSYNDGYHRFLYS